MPATPSPEEARATVRQGIAEKGEPRQPGERDDGRWADDFKGAGKPDLNNPAEDLAYVRKLQMICLRQMATTPFPSAAQQNCWKRIKDMSAVCGMTSNKAQLESTVKRLRKMVEGRQELGTVREEAKVARNPEARGGMTGPRAIDGEDRKT